MSEQRPTSPLKDLKAKLEAARERRAAASLKENGNDSGQKGGLGFAFRIGIELVSAVAVGVAIGLLLDYWLGTRPWLMVAFFILGSAAGFLNVYRTTRGLGYAVGYEEEKEAKPRDGEGRDATRREPTERDTGSK